jgi:hypothetical protein
MQEEMQLLRAKIEFEEQASLHAERETIRYAHAHHANAHINVHTYIQYINNLHTYIHTFAHTYFQRGNPRANGGRCVHAYTHT